jgi:branched-chain amino acid transport system ATP-binding protein
MALLECTGVTHSFGGLTAVSGFDLSVEPGELIGIIGPNGAGKTTVFNLITGVYRPREGSIIFEGNQLVGKPPDAICSCGIARTFQNIRLFKDLSVLDNVRTSQYSQVRYSAVEALVHVGRYRAEEERVTAGALELLELFGLSDYTGETAKNLPYGLQRRLEMARALATRPRLLLLDEPAAGMNSGEIVKLMETIQRIRKEFAVTILLIEHQMKLVMNICERLVVLDFGQTIARGTPDQIRQNPKVLEAYLGEEVAV